MKSGSLANYGSLTNYGSGTTSLGMAPISGAGELHSAPFRPYGVARAENGGIGAPRSSAGGDRATANEDDDPRIKRMRVEAVLLLAKTSLSTRKLAQLAHLADGTEARTLVRQLNGVYETHGRSLRVESVAGGYRLLTRPVLAPWMVKLGHLPPAVRLSTPMMETLAVVAYRQPVSRASAEAVRGVACGELLRQLMERDLIRIAGRGEELGRPYLYGTTKRFLQLFGLPNADALPPIQWQTLQDEPDQDDGNPESPSLDFTTDDFSTSPKECAVSTVVAPVLAEADPLILVPNHSLDPESDSLAPESDSVSGDRELRAEVDKKDDDDDDDDDWGDDDDEDDIDDDWDDDDDDDEDDDDDDEDDDDDDLDDLDDDEWQEVDDEDDDDDEKGDDDKKGDDADGAKGSSDGDKQDADDVDDDDDDDEDWDDEEDGDDDAADDDEDWS